MSVFEAFFQGLIQGLTEFLPVSSSGHLSLFQYFTGNNSETGFVFSILLHAGTLIAVCIVFWRTIVSLIAEAFSLIFHAASPHAICVPSGVCFCFCCCLSAHCF